MHEGAAPRAVPPLCRPGRIVRSPLYLPTGVIRLLLERRGHAVRIRVGGRLDHEHDAAVQLCTRLIAPRAAIHLTRLTVADGIDEGRIETLARDVGLHGLGAAPRELGV